jgi:hypothetical protein
MDEAVEAGLLVEAYRSVDELIEDCDAEATGEIDTAKGHTRWKILALEYWAKDHEDDSSQEHIGPELRLPPTFAVHVTKLVKVEIAKRLAELGVPL